MIEAIGPEVLALLGNRHAGYLTSEAIPRSNVQ